MSTEQSLAQEAREAETLLGLRVGYHAPTVEVLETLAQGLDHLEVSEDVERLDDALVELPRKTASTG